MAPPVATSEHIAPITSSVVRLGEVASLRAELVQPATNDDLVYVGLEHLDSGNPRLNRSGLPSEVSSAKARFYPGDVLYGKLRPYLDKAALVTRVGICSTDILVLRSGPGLRPEYLAYLLHTGRFINYAVSTTAGVNHPRTSWSSISDFTFSLPILTEQDAIVAALDAIQDAIGALRHEAALERERKAALMHHLFTRGTRGEPRKQTEIGEMPEGWQIAALNSVSEIAYGLTVNKARRISSRLAPYLTVANVTRGALRLGDIKQIGMLSSDSESYRLRYGDVLFVEGSGNPELLGSAAVWNDELPFALHQNHLIRARPDQHAVLPLWIMSYFNSASGRAQLLGRATTSSGLHNINSRLLGSLLLPVPPMAEQFTIIRVYESCDARIIGLEHEVATLRELFDTMLNDLMTGRLPVHPCSP